MSNFLTLEQVAEQLQLHVRTVRRYVREGRLKAQRVGKQYLVTPEDLQAFSGMQAPSVSRRVENNAVVDITLQNETGIRADTLYYESEGRLKVILHGELAATIPLLEMLATLLEQRA